MSGVCNRIQTELEKAFPPDPNAPKYEKWKRGRPTEEAKERRRLYNEYWNDKRPKVGFIEHLLNGQWKGEKRNIVIRRTLKPESEQ